MVLAAKGDLRGANAQHRGGVVLVAWVALHGLVRLVLAATRFPRRLWWVDLTASAASTAAVFGVVAIVGR